MSAAAKSLNVKLAIKQSLVTLVFQNSSPQTNGCIPLALSTIHYTVCGLFFAESPVSGRATYHHMHIFAYMSAMLWIISSKEELVGIQNKQWFSPSLWRKYLQRAAAKKNPLSPNRLFLWRPFSRHINQPLGQLEAPPDTSQHNKCLGAQWGFITRLGRAL